MVVIREEVPRMRPTVPVFLSLILLAGLLPASAEAGSIRCVKVGFARGAFISPYTIRCNHAEGNVQWNASVLGASFTIKDDRGRIKETFTLGTRNTKDFNLHSIHEGDAFKEKLESMGYLPRGHSHEIHSFWLDDRLPMFNDFDGEDPMGTIAEVNRRMEPPDRCFYTSDPWAFAVEGAETAFCFGPVQCRPKNGGSEYTTSAFCAAPDIQGDVGRCPDASWCLHWEDESLFRSLGLRP